MAEASTVGGDLTVRGTLSPQAINMPQNAIDSDAQIKAGTNISADKTQTRIYRSHSQPNTAATAETRTLFIARKTGTVKEIRVGSIVAATGDSTTTVNVLKNGTTILSSSVVLNNANTARTSVAAAISSSALVAGDWLDVAITISAGTGTLPTGLFVQMEIDQNGT